MLRRLTVPILTVALVAATAACNREKENAAPPVKAARPDSSSGEVAQYALMKNSIGWLTDSNIVALASQVNSSVQDIPQLELQTWASEPIHRLAMDIIRDHARLQASIDSLVSVKRLPPQMPAVAPAMKAPYDSLLATQIGLPMADREAQLTEMVLKTHARSTTDFGALAGNASDPDLRALLANRGVLMEQTHVARTQLLEAAMVRTDSIKQDSAKNQPKRGRRP